MYPYQLSKALAEQRINDKVAAASRHRMTAAPTTKPTSGIDSSTRVKGLLGRLQAVLAVFAVFSDRREAGSGLATRSSRTGAPAVTSGSGAGPMGCVV
jgi:hypothetical protein